MTTRVQLGRLDSITGGTNQFGVYVTGPDGTVIVDGTSNMFKIQASGSVSLTVAASTMEVTSETSLPGLGTFTETPASLAWISLGQASTDAKRQNPYVNSAGSVKFAANTSGGSPTSPSGTWDTLCHVDTRLSSGVVTIRIGGSNATGSSEDFFAYFYVLQETAF